MKVSPTVVEALHAELSWQEAKWQLCKYGPVWRLVNTLCNSYVYIKIISSIIFTTLYRMSISDSIYYMHVHCMCMYIHMYVPVPFVHYLLYTYTYTACMYVSTFILFTTLCLYTCTWYRWLLIVLCIFPFILQLSVEYY